MNYFKDENNKIYAYDDEQVEAGYGANLIPITEAEKDAILAPTPEELAEQAKAERRANFNKAWDNVKIGYNPTSKIAFQIQYGNEINETLDATKLYNISDLNNIVEVAEDDYLFKLDQDNVNIMNAKLNAEWKVTHKKWYGSLGTYQLSNIEIGVILAKGDEVVQQYADEILGEAK